MVPALRGGKSVVARDDAYALWELLHAVRDNTNLDLRESVPQFFKDFPIEHLLSHYPATYDAAENQYRIGITRKTGEPDLRAAALSRAAELAMVALDVNGAESQVLQGWLMHDHFMLRGTYGAPYEFLWANPYQPGLSYYHVPLIYHNANFGKLFVRSSWDEDAEWFGYFDGVIQMFAQGRPTPLTERDRRRRDLRGRDRPGRDPGTGYAARQAGGGEDQGDLQCGAGWNPAAGWQPAWSAGWRGTLWVARSLAD